jgi:NADH-quinone oxidoreductase subunit J
LLQELAFYVPAFVCVSAALYATFSSDFFHCAMGLLIVLFTVAGFFLQLHSPVLAMFQVLVYGGAVTILILFAVMMIYRMGSGTEKRFLPPAFVAMAVLVFSLLFVFLMRIFLLTTWPESVAERVNFSATAIGKGILGQFLLAFDLLSVLLLAVMVGVTTLVGKSGNGDSSAKESGVAEKVVVAEITAVESVPAEEGDAV